jgi:hypothetical protein
MVRNRNTATFVAASEFIKCTFHPLHIWLRLAVVCSALVTYAAPVRAEGVTLRCIVDPPAPNFPYVAFTLDVDIVRRTVSHDKGRHPAEITDRYIMWISPDGMQKYRIDRNTGIYAATDPRTHPSAGQWVETHSCQRAQTDILRK